MSFFDGEMIPGSGAPMVPVALFGSAPSLAIILSNNSIADNATVGTLVGNLSVVGGTGSYTFTLTYNPNGLFSISGSALQVAAALGAFDGVNAIVVHADNGAGSTVDQAFIINITASGAQSEPIPFIF